MSFCGKCGKELNDGVKFCPACGEPTENGTQQNEKAPATQATHIRMRKARLRQYWIRRTRAENMPEKI